MRLTDELEARSNLTRTQFLVWTGQKLAPASPMYNMAWRFDLEADVDPDLFRAAFESVVRRCDALRLVVEERDGAPVQRALDGPAGAFRVFDADAPGPWIEERTRQVFDIARRTFDSTLLRTGAGWTWHLNQHHLATDAASGRIIFDETAAAYRALAEGRAPSEDRLPSFLAHAEAERAARDARADAEAAEWWTSRAADAAPLPRLYGGRETGATPDAVRFARPLGEARAAALRDLAAQDGFEALSAQQALFNVFATIEAAWIARVSGQPRAAIGVMTHGRRTQDDRRTVGHFVELFPLLLDVAPDDTFRSLHRRAAEAGFDLLRHAAPGASSAAGQAGFNAVLNVIPGAFGDFAGAPVRAEWLHSGATDPQHVARLSLHDFEGAGLASMSLHLNRSALDAEIAERAPDHVLRLLDAMLADPDAAIGKIPLAGPDEASSRLTAGPAAPPRPAADVVAAFRAQAARAPDAACVRDHDGETSWAALDARSDAVAAALRARAEPGARIGVHLRRSAALVAAVLGVLKAGMTFVPLDPLQPRRRLELIAAEAGLSLCLHERGTAPPAAPALAIEDAPDAGGRVPDAPADAAPAYVMFTSGSTGTPKGVAIGRAALSRYAAWAAGAFAGGPATWSLHSAIGFDLTITSIFAPLVSGGAIRAYRETGEPDLSILRVFEEDAAEVVKLTPAHLALAAEAGRPVRRIRTLVLGGEPLTTALCRRARSVLGAHLEIVNEYGPTEATVGCMIRRYDAEADDDRPTVPIGRPADDTSIYVLDAGGNPVPDGAVGELCVAGPDRLADGYLNMPAETEARFPPDPFRPDRRMYRTGDLASVEPSGLILHHGRDDAQIKLRGVRIEPAEIARAALDHPDVLDCAVGLHEPPSGRCARCGLEAAHPDAKLDAEGVCRPCRAYDAVRDKARAYFRAPEDLERVVAAAAERRRGQHDCVMMLSGGKDSTYALCRLAEMTPRVLAATLDNGFISDDALANVRRACERLGVEHRTLTTPAMNEIFADSLARHANVCNGCFKAIYTLGLKLAREVGAPLLVTGLSRGQLFETRLAPELFDRDEVDVEAIDRGVLEARKAYHRAPDVAARRLNGDLFDDGAIFDEVAIVDFYRYFDVPVSEIYAYLEANVPWTRPRDTGRSTNCLINDAGIWVHKRARGYHNYALPYSWDVRMGHKSREEALAELDDEIDEDRVRRILDRIGFPPPEPVAQGPTLVCHYVARGTLTADDLRRRLSARLPREMMPELVRVDALPLTPNGKVDRSALPAPTHRAARSRPPGRPPRPGLESRVAGIWRQVLRLDAVGADEDFYELGGDSLAAIQIAARAEAEGIRATAVDVFRLRTVERLAAAAEAQDDAAAPSPAETKPRPRAGLNAAAQAALAQRFGTRRDG